MRIVIRQYTNNNDDDAWSTEQDWALRFPIAIHCAWVSVATLVNLTMRLIVWRAGSGVELFMALLSLLVIVPVFAGVAAIVRGNYTVPLVYLWATVRGPIHSMSNKHVRMTMPICLSTLYTKS
jgi:hypothetical protein